MGKAASLANIGTIADSSLGFRNRIINGAMVIDQRNAGASVTPTVDGTYTLDRYVSLLSQASKFSVQRNAGSVTPPAGFSNYYGVTSLSAYSVGASERFGIQQGIEGFNIADFAWGTASAATVTLSFWVRSSLTGTFGGSLLNGSGALSYPFSYTISAANTWEQKSITIAGPTTGTWASDNTGGLYLRISLGAGASISGTAGAWVAGNLTSATGATSVVGTNGATFYITGVQLEKGSTATSFDYRPYTTELQLCQRYLPAWNTSVTNEPFGTGIAYSATGSNIFLAYQVQPRVSPTGITASAASSFYLLNATNGIAGSYATTTFYKGSLNGLNIVSTTSAGLVAGNGTILATNTGPAQILATGCEL
jgi:hypothetical protein